MPFHQRGAILDEQLEAMAAPGATRPRPIRGSTSAFADVYLEPKPFRPEGPRMWFGGQSLHPALLRRLVRYGHGFHPFGSPTPERARAAARGDGRGRARRRRARDDRRHPRDVRRRDERRRSRRRPQRRSRASSRRATPRSASSRRCSPTTSSRSGRSAASSSRASPRSRRAAARAARRSPAPAPAPSRERPTVRRSRGGTAAAAGPLR